MIRILSTAVIAVFLSACAVMAPPPPNPVFVSQIDSYFSKVQTRTYKSAGVFSKPIPYKVGQYVVTGMTHSTERSVMITSIVGQEQGGWILETRSLTESSDSISQMLVVGLETVVTTGNLDDIDIIWYKTKSHDQPVQQFNGTLLTMMKGLMKSSLSGFAIQIQTPHEDGGTVKVFAGTFKGTTKTRGEVSFLGKKYTSDSWLHPAVPINGMVKSVTNTEDQTIELLEFGLSGAKRSF